MAITFLRIDDRIIHGQVVTRWAMENPCDGILAVDDHAATNPILKSALKSASTKKTLIYTFDEFVTKAEQAAASDKKYFLITKEPEMMKKLLVDVGVKTEARLVNVGPQSARANVKTTNVNNNADISENEALDYEEMFESGYEVEFQLVPDAKKVKWKDVRDKII